MPGELSKITRFREAVWRFFQNEILLSRGSRWSSGPARRHSTPPPVFFALSILSVKPFAIYKQKMTLEDFEKALAEEGRERQEKGDREKRHRDRSRDRSSRHHRHRHHRHSSRSGERGLGRRDRESRHSDENGHQHKRSRHSTDHGDDRDRSHKRRHRHESRDDGSAGTRESVKEVVQEEPSRPKRDAWMEAPSALSVDYVNRRDSTRLQEPQPKMLQADFDLKIHNREINNHLHDLKDGKALEEVEEEPAQHEVDYEFGDAGSQWRMTRLKAVYREAEESGKSVEEIAFNRFGDLRSFDDAREEEAELDRRETYGEGYVGKVKPSGELSRSGSSIIMFGETPTNMSGHQGENTKPKVRASRWRPNRLQILHSTLI